jgi:hypothetical protein
VHGAVGWTLGGRLDGHHRRGRQGLTLVHLSSQPVSPVSLKRG